MNIKSNEENREMSDEEILAHVEIGKKQNSDKAKSMRKGKQKDFTALMRMLILACLHSDNKDYSEKTALALIQPKIFESLQERLFKSVLFKVDYANCEDGKVLAYKDLAGEADSIKLRSLENAVSKLRKLRYKDPF